MSCCFSVYFLVVFKTVLRWMWTIDFVELKIVLWVLFVELGGLITPSVNRQCLATSCLTGTTTPGQSGPGSNDN